MHLVGVECLIIWGLFITLFLSCFVFLIHSDNIELILHKNTILFFFFIISDYGLYYIYASNAQ